MKSVKLKLLIEVCIFDYLFVLYNYIPTNQTNLRYIQYD